MKFLAATVMTLLVGACNSLPGLSPGIDNMMALQFNGTVVSPAAAMRSVDDIDVLSISPQIINYFDTYVSKSMPQQQRARMLHRVLRSQAFLGVEYNAGETLTAEETFLKETANCISFANLYIALARHYGLDARYQLLKRHPEWNRRGLIVSRDIHINSVLRLLQSTNLVVDISYSGVVDQTILISDDVAKALFYNNLAIAAFSEGDHLKAYSLMAKAINLAPEQSLLWANLGAIYRNNQQFDAAEAAYKLALIIDPNSYTAVNNLVVLYKHLQQWQPYERYQQRLSKLQQNNPYYHYFLAQFAQQNDNYQDAINHIQSAIALKNNEPEFILLRDQLHLQLQRMAINSLKPFQTSSGLKASIQSDMARSLPSKVQRLP